MAENKQSIVYEFTMETAELVKNIEVAKQELRDLKKAEQELNEQRDEGIVTGDAYIKKLSDLKVAQEQQKIVIKSNTDVLKANAKQMTATNGSLEQMRGQLRKLQIEYDNLSEAERKSAKGEEMRKKLEVLNNDIKGVEMSTGRFGRNVGNYLNSIKSAFADAGGASAKLAGGVAGITTKVKALMAVPIIAIINAIIFVIQKVIGALKSNEEAFNRVRVAMSGFQGIGTIITKVLQGLGNAVAWVVEKLGAMLTKIKGVSEEAQKQQALTKQQIALEKRKRQITQENADLELEASKLLNQVEQRNVYSAKQRLAFVDEANAKLLKIAKNNEELAKRNYQIIKDRNALTASSTEDLQEEADAYAEMKRAEKEYFDRSKELATKRVELQNQIRAEQDAIFKKQQEMAQALVDQLKDVPRDAQRVADAIRGIEDALTEVNESASDFNPLGDIEEMNARIEEMQLRLANNAKAQLDGSIAQLEANVLSAQYAKRTLYQEEDETAEEFRSRQIDAEKAYVDAKQALADKEKEIAISKFEAIATMTNGLVGLLNSFGEENREAAIASKIVALAQIAIESGVAVSKAIASGAGVPFPANIGAIATGVSAVLIGITNAINTVKSAKFATGGYVQGAGTSTSDSIPARLSNGESVINARSTKMFYPLLSAINQAGGGVAFGGEHRGNKFANGGVINYETINAGRASADITQITKAIEKMQPIVSVREITRVQNRVKAKEER